MKTPELWTTRILLLSLAVVAQQPLWSAPANAFTETDLVSDLPGVAAHLDPNLVNPWGIAYSPTGPFWVANNKSGVSTIYDGQGVANSLVVSVPPSPGATPPSAPTGIVFNGGTAFEVAPGRPARFLFASEEGTLSGWNPAANPSSAILMVDNSVTASYTGLTLANNGSGDFLYAANFAAATIDVFDRDFAPAALAGSFTDPNLPAGFAPFNVQNLGNELYVSYALRDAQTGDEVTGSGQGLIDVFDLNGNFDRRLVSNGPLNAPWGLTVADSDFGPFGDALLVGNFGDGRINAFDPLTGELLGTLEDPQGQPLEIPGLWALTFGNGGNAGSTDALYFTAGIADEGHGLFGKIAPAAAPDSGASTIVLLGTTLVGLLGSRRGRGPRQLSHPH